VLPGFPNPWATPGIFMTTRSKLEEERRDS
jgi:hypothetical protein